MPDVQRAHQRVSSVLPVTVDGRVAGKTRDVSPAGIYFETDLELAKGSSIDFDLTFDGAPGKLVLHCSGEIVRVEKSGSQLGVAAKIVESRLERIAEKQGSGNTGAQRSQPVRAHETTKKEKP